MASDLRLMKSFKWCLHSFVYSLFQDGHELGNHTWSHPHFKTHTPPQRVYDEIKKTDLLLQSFGYKKKNHFRAPHGAQTLTLSWVLSSLNKKNILYSGHADDWKCPGTQVIVDKTLEYVKPGSIALLHDGGGDCSQTVAAARIIIKKLKRRGYRFVTISQLLTIKNHAQRIRTKQVNKTLAFFNPHSWFSDLRNKIF